jgi:nitrile hydratase accessory protein
MYLTTTWISTDARRAVAVNIESASSPLLCKGLPTGDDADFKFAEPWEAKIFAIIVGLSKDGHFSWADWVECFSKEVAAATAVEAAGGDELPYYVQWLNAAEKLLISKGVTTQEQLLARRFAVGSVGSMHVLK